MDPLLVFGFVAVVAAVLYIVIRKRKKVPTAGVGVGGGRPSEPVNVSKK